jgi:transcriptional regulator with XRE-family HTH domain
MTTAEKIKQLRKAQHMTQTELGDRLGVQKNAVSKWECGRVEAIPPAKLRQMAQIFQVPVSYLVETDPDLEAAVQNLHLTISDTDPQISALLHTAAALNAQGLARLCQLAQDLSGNPAFQKVRTSKKSR